MTPERTPDAGPNPVQQWYRKRADGLDGPWSAEQLLVEVASGRVLPDDLVKTDTMPEWMAAKSVKGLEFTTSAAGPPPLPVKPPPLPSQSRPRLIPPSLPKQQPAAKARRSQSVIWGYFGVALFVLTVGLGVAVVILKDRERAETASSPPTSGSFEPLLTDRLNTQATQPTASTGGSGDTLQPKSSSQQPSQSESPSVGLTEPLTPKPPSPTPDRRVAEWVVQDGGTVVVDVPDSMGGKRVEWKKADEIEDKAFTVIGVRLRKNTRITSDYLAPLSGLSRLEELDLWESSLADDDMRAVVALRSLERLTVGVTRLTPKGLARVGDLTNLTELNIAGLPVDTNAIQQIGKLNKLVVLLTGGCQIPDADLVHLTGLQRLEILGLIDNFKVTDKAMVHLGKLKNLKTIRVKGSKLTDQAVKRVLPNCEVTR